MVTLRDGNAHLSGRNKKTFSLHQYRYHSSRRNALWLWRKPEISVNALGHVYVSPHVWMGTIRGPWLRVSKYYYTTLSYDLYPDADLGTYWHDARLRKQELVRWCRMNGKRLRFS